MISSYYLSKILPLRVIVALKGRFSVTMGDVVGFRVSAGFRWVSDSIRWSRIRRKHRPS